MGKPEEPEIRNCPHCGKPLAVRITIKKEVNGTKWCEVQINALRKIEEIDGQKVVRGCPKADDWDIKELEIQDQGLLT